jgi:hypothetical protein
VSTSGFNWDEGNLAKCQKHGLSLADVEFVLANSKSIVLPATGLDETRLIAIGPTPQGRLAFVVFTTREKGGRSILRPISARYMHRKEISKYGQAIAGLQKR